VSHMKRTTFTMSLSHEVFGRLTAAAGRFDVSRGAVVRMALQDWFNRHDPDIKDSGRMGLRLQKDLLKTHISIPRAAVQRRKKNRLDFPHASTGDVSKPQDPNS
jgi:predicted transcriptional regulator